MKISFHTKDNELYSDLLWVYQDWAANGDASTTEIEGFLKQLVAVKPSNHHQENLLNAYVAYKKSKCPSVTIDARFTELIEHLKTLSIKRITFHCGTPKTGSSSFQSTIFNSRQVLFDNAILYPKQIKNAVEPKHQKIVTTMKNNDFNGLVEYLLKVFDPAEIKQFNQVLISTEGIYNHWGDFSNEIKSLFTAINQIIPVDFYLVLREPVGFLYSMYVQNLKNPQRTHPSCFGHDLTFEAMLSDPWFANHMDYLRFILDIEHLVGLGTIKLFEYSDQIVQNLLKELGLTVSKQQVLTKNVTSKKIPTTELRKLNRLNLPADEKQKAMDQLKTKNHATLADDEINPITIQNIKQLFVLQQLTLEKFYNFTFKENE